MSKLFKFVLLPLIVINVIFLATYFSSSAQPDFRQAKMEELSQQENNLSEEDFRNPREYLQRNLNRTIQATFVRVSDGKIFFRERGSDDTVKQLQVDSPLLYICIPPTSSPQISLNSDFSGHRDFVDPEVLNIDLFENDPIAIATIVNSSGEEVVNHLISAKCPEVNE